ncbi:MAG: hypothetical protein DI598_01845 [Pseudopedobacter saltans]|uniref:Uncharacterized protein n=1 Tax=Pseudopedobacter saltans TaxID=151895 RepID=A0A2W5HE71_9SPHI|nr:MAG: hypothetical protein DI598_01845 [Pseudopedobacter saltans]
MQANISSNILYKKGRIFRGFALFVVTFFFFSSINAQVDTTILVGSDSLTLPTVIVKSGLNTESLLRRIKQDSSFYKAFKTLRIVGYVADNDMRMKDKKGNVKATYNSKIKQIREGNCRSMQVLSQQTTGDMLDKKGKFEYMTGQMFAGLFLTDGKVCGETNIVGNMQFDLSGKSGIEKHKEQLKMLFFNPGRKIPGIPFIGNKLDLYDGDAREKYNYRLDTVNFFGHSTYRFAITPKPDASGIVIDNMTTWFDAESMDVLGRTYAMSYHAGLYGFDVKMNVRLVNIGGLLVPVDMQYDGNWSVVLKGREIGTFHAKLSDFSIKK